MTGGQLDGVRTGVGLGMLMSNGNPDKEEKRSPWNMLFGSGEQHQQCGTQQVVDVDDDEADEIATPVSQHKETHVELEGNKADLLEST